MAVKYLSILDEFGNPLVFKNIETTDNRVASISEESTDDQYPSAKCVYDLVGNVEDLLSEL